MAYYRKKVAIEAMQWTGDNTREVYTFIYGAPPTTLYPMAQDRWDDYCDLVRENGLTIATLEDGPDGRAKHVASVGDWIIRGVQGECYACKPDIFEATYEPAA